MEEPTLRKVDWLAELLGVSRKRAYELIAQGTVPAAAVVRAGRAIRVNVDQVLAWVGAGGTR